MAKVEVVREGGYHRVQVTYREPFEDFFEIAVHVAKFVHPRDASRLRDRVQAAIRAIAPQMSPGCALTQGLWNYRSSAQYDVMQSLCVEYVVEPSERAKAEDLAYDMSN